MKQLKSSIYKNICSVLASDDQTLKTSQNQVLFSRVISEYPSKSIHCLSAHRLLSFFEKSVNNVSLILEIMVDEGEDEEIIENIKFLRDNPSITSQAEVTQMCIMLADYIKYARILKVKNSMIQAMDLIDDEEAPIKQTVDTLYNLSNQITMAYNVANVTATSHTFDTDDKDSMKMVVAATKDVRSADGGIRTSIRGLNMLLSPAYLSGQLCVYAGLPGNYKSGILLQSHIDTCRYNEHLKKSLNGKIPISMYISMENSMEQTIGRLWSLLFPTADISLFSVDEATEMITNALTEKGCRSVILYYGYREKSTADIANIIRSYNTETTQVVALYFDYIKRVRSARTDAAATASEKAELHAIMNEFKLMSIQFNIPIVTGHQLNRVAAQAIEDAIAKGNYDKSAELLGSSQIGTAFEVVEVADKLFIIYIENNGDQKYLMIKAAKQRDKQSTSDNDVKAIRHPFLSTESFALQPDIMENCSLSIPIYIGKQLQNFVTNI